METVRHKESRILPCSQCDITNKTLVQSGFLGASPDTPALAISIELLEIYWQLCCVCP